MRLNMENDSGQMIIHAKAARSLSFEETFKDIVADSWNNLTDVELNFIFHFSS